MTKQGHTISAFTSDAQGNIILNDFVVKCPKCGHIRVYTPNTHTTDISKARFTCTKCIRQFSVLLHWTENKRKKFIVKCPKCGKVREYSPRTEETNLDKAKFTCKICKVRSSVSAHLMIEKKSVLKGRRNVQVNREHVPHKSVKDAKMSLNPKGINIWELPDEDLKVLFRDFVGWVDDKGDIHPGQAVPEPIDEITGQYMGIADYQLDFIIRYRDNPNILMIWARGHGKTWVMTWIIQFCMKYEADRFLYFSLTDVAYTVADWIYIWAQNQNAVVEKDTIRAAKKISGRKSTYQKFSLVNGARYEVHGIRTSSTLGYHGWILIMDDIIDEQHKRLPHLQKALEMKWDHQYSKIRRKKLVMCNTRKFAGDYFDFIITQFEKKLKIYTEKKGETIPKYVLFISHKTPYTQLQFEGGVPAYRKFLADLERNRIPYDETIILAGWFIKEDFDAMKAENLKSFFAEMIGNPRPLEGGNWQKEDLVFIPFYEPFDYEAAGIIVDPAWTITEESAQSGITIVGLKGEMKDGRRQYTVFKSWGKKLKPKKWKDKKTGKEYDGLLDFVQRQFEWLKLYFAHTRFLFVIFELSSGGSVLVNIALAEREIYTFADYIPDIEEKENKWISNIVNPKIDKLDRIDSELYDVIKNGDLNFVDILEEGGLIFQILTFPDCDYFDQIDALALAISYLRRVKTVSLNLDEKKKFIADIKENRRRIMEDSYEEKYGLKGLRENVGGRTSGRRGYNIR